MSKTHPFLRNKIYSFYNDQTKFLTGILIAILLLTITSCRKDEVKHDEKVIDITDVYDKSLSKVNLSQIATKIEYIPLQNDPASILGSISWPFSTSLKFFSNKILIKDDSEKLLMFDGSGNFLSKIGSVGRGPGEFKEVNGFTILDSVIVVNSRLDRKFIYYDLKGNFLKETDPGFVTEGLFSINDNLVSVNSFLFRKASGYHNLNVFTSKGELKNQLIYRSNEKKLEKNGYQYWASQPDLRSAYKLNNRQFFWEHGLYNGKDTIWEIKNNFEVVPRHVIYFSGKRIPVEMFWKDVARTYDIKGTTNLSQFIETNNHMFLEFRRIDKRLKIYRNREKKLNTSIGFTRKSGNGVHFAFHNDINGGMPFWPDGMLSDNKVYKLLYGNEVRDFLNTRTEKEKGAVIDKVASEQLKNMVQDAKITDNPILMVVTLK